MIQTPFLLLATVFAFLSAMQVHAQNCDCEKNLDSLISSVEANYIGFERKMVEPAYTDLKATLKEKGRGEVDFNCFLVLKKYLEFFKDPHLDVHIKRPKEGTYDSTIRAMFTGLSKVPVDIAHLEAQLSRSNSIEGIWKAKEFPFTMAIIKSKTPGVKYVGVTLTADSVFFNRGDVKIEILESGKLKYFANDHYPSFNTFQIDKNILYINGMSTWEKILPKDPSFYVFRDPASYKKITKEIGVLTINSFNISNKRFIDSIVGTNIVNIKKNIILLIDLRNNGGGHVMSCDTLIPLIYTDPLIRDGFIVRSSRDNIAIYKRQLENPNFSESDKQRFQTLIDTMEKHIGEVVTISAPDTMVYSAVANLPQKVGILVNEGTASMSETFLLWAKQSSKVTILGSNSRGALDYTETGGGRKLLCPYLTYTCPMGSSEHKVTPYIDNVGIEPDVKIPGAEPDWINFAIRYYSSH